MQKIYQHAQEKWTDAQCSRRAKYRKTDAYGSKAFHAGLINDYASASAGYGQTRIYNGGIIIEGVHYDGEHKPFPILPDGWGLVSVPTWGDKIKPKQ